MTATSASNRHAHAQNALHTFDKITGFTAPEDAWERAEAVAYALRALIEPPATVETPERIAEKIYLGWVADDDDRRTERELLAAAVHAGIQAAWESWEPETAPGAEIFPGTLDALGALTVRKGN